MPAVQELRHVNLTQQVETTLLKGKEKTPSHPLKALLLSQLEPDASSNARRTKSSHRHRSEALVLKAFQWSKVSYQQMSPVSLPFIF